MVRGEGEKVNKKIVARVFAISVVSVFILSALSLAAGEVTAGVPSPINKYWYQPYGFSDNWKASGGTGGFQLYQPLYASGDRTTGIAKSSMGATISGNAGSGAAYACVSMRGNTFYEGGSRTCYIYFQWLVKYHFMGDASSTQQARMTIALHANLWDVTSQRWVLTSDYEVIVEDRLLSPGTIDLSTQKTLTFGFSPYLTGGHTYEMFTHTLVQVYVQASTWCDPITGPNALIYMDYSPWYADLLYYRAVHY